MNTIKTIEMNILLQIRFLSMEVWEPTSHQYQLAKISYCNNQVEALIHRKLSVLIDLQEGVTSPTCLSWETTRKSLILNVIIHI